MNKYFVLSTLTLCLPLFALQSPSPEEPPKPAPYGPALDAGKTRVNANLVVFSSPEGRRRLLTADGNDSNDFFELAPHYQPQMNPNYCAAASGTIILNAFRLPSRAVPLQPVPLSIRKPLIPGSPDWNGKLVGFFEYVQSAFFRNDVATLKPKDKVDMLIPAKVQDGKPSHYDPGVILSDFAAYLEYYGLEVTTKFAGEVSQAEMEADLLKTVRDTDHYFIANFRGATLGALTYGHMSPLVAVSGGSVLVLDVAAHKNAWYWAPIADMYNAMNTIDSDSGKSRGYLLVSEKAKK